MKIDTEIRHVTKPGANLFLELGFTAAEAKRLQAASRKQINDTRLLKQQLMEELTVWIAKHHLKQAEAAEILMVSRPRVSDVVNKKTAKTQGAPSERSLPKQERRDARESTPAAVPAALRVSKTMNSSIPVYQADGSLYASVSEQRLTRLQAAGLLARVVRSRKGQVQRAGNSAGTPRAHVNGHRRLPFGTPPASEPEIRRKHNPSAISILQFANHVFSERDHSTRPYQLPRFGAPFPQGTAGNGAETARTWTTPQPERFISREMAFWTTQIDMLAVAKEKRAGSLLKGCQNGSRGEFR
jgi:predicted XRE-type DNA-binding protein